MKSYLDLIPLSAKIHRKQTRMTRLCIVISVFLIAAIFSMADLFLQSQKNQAILSDGAWHVGFKSLSQEQITFIGARPDVLTLTRYAATNYRLDMDYEIDGTKTVVCGFDESFFDLMPGIRLSEGTFPSTDQEALVSESVRDHLSLSVGDPVTLLTPDGPLTFCVSGFLEDTSSMLKNGAFGIFLDTDSYLARFQDATLSEDVMCYVEFSPHCRIRKSIEEIKATLQIPDENAGENAKLMGLLLQSSDSYILSLYLIALILALLVVFSGILMMLGSMNSSVAKRTEFFGMMRCLGATVRQVRHFVLFEALSWCKTAIPTGLFSSAVVVWVLCQMLKVTSPTWFQAMPVLSVSIPGLLTGCVIGLLTVLLAAWSPARKASLASPLEAVSGNAGTVFTAKHAANTRLFPVEAALGVHHAAGSRKNLLLLTASFAFSIILFLNFSIGIDFMQHALTPLRPYTPDLSVVSPDNGCTIPASLLKTLADDPAVEKIFGRSFAYDLPVRINGVEKKAMLISYEANQFGWATGDLTAGDMDQAENGNGILLVEKAGFSAQVGDQISLTTGSGTETLTVQGLLRYAPFQSGEDTLTLICSETLFREVTGEHGYTILDLQLNDRSDTVAERIRDTAGGDFVFSDQRASNQETRAVYYSFSLFVYGFLAVIILIAIFNIINSIGMSVSARMNQYGAMRAIGISIRQLGTMIVTETVSYLFCGLITGLFLGLSLYRFLYGQAVTARWGDPFRFPFWECGIIGIVMILAAVLAVAGPIRQLRRLSVVDTIRER